VLHGESLSGAGCWQLPSAIELVRSWHVTVLEYVPPPQGWLQDVKTVKFQTPLKVKLLVGAVVGWTVEGWAVVGWAVVGWLVSPIRVGEVGVG
jgi:hypothetical protein